MPPTCFSIVGISSTFFLRSFRESAGIDAKASGVSAVVWRTSNAFSCSRKASISETSKPCFFSSNFACPHCGYSMAELEPRLFSFNNPAGACQSCDGLGTRQFFDPHRIIANDEISLSGGAIRGWDKRSYYYYQMLLFF